jgi:predicted helicase
MINTNLTSIDSLIIFINSLNSTKEKGDMFELFAKYYMLNFANIKEYYLSNEIPDKIASYINICTINKDGKEKGIDALIVNNNEYYSVQVKYRSDKNTNLAFGELATFMAQSDSRSDKIKRRYLITTTYNVCSDYHTQDTNKKYLLINYYDLCKNCNGDLYFWKGFKKFIDKGIIDKITHKPLIPLAHQKEIIDTGIKYYSDNNNLGRLISCCGSGKTLIGYWIFNGLNYNTCVIYVPSLELLSQTFYEWKREYKANNIRSEFLLIGSQMMDKIEDYKNDFDITTSQTDIDKFITTKSNNKRIIISTYQSSDILIKSFIDNKIKFDFTIYDEAHHTCQSSDKQMYSKTILVDISNKKIFMTATEKILNIKSTNEDDEIISMDNEKLYGKLIYSYNFYKAIQDNQLSDYRIVSPCLTNEKSIEHIKNNNQIIMKGEKLGITSDNFIIAYLIIDSIQNKNLKKIILYSSNTKKAKFIKQAIEILLDQKEYNKLKTKIKTFYIDGKTNRRNRRKYMNEFTKSDIGIISSVKIFNEGVNIEICDSVCFCDIKSSEIDVVQSIGRCLRKIHKCSKCSSILGKCKCLTEKDIQYYKNKIGYVIIPMIINEKEEFFSSDNKQLKKLRNILKIMGTTDEGIKEKFEIYIPKSSKSSLIDNYNNNDNNSKIRANNESKELNSIEAEILQKNIVSYTFDRSGSIIDYTRQILINENEVRYKNKLNLLDSKDKAFEYLKNQGQDISQLEKRNWVKYCLGVKLFDKIKQKYYWDLDELKDSCNSIDIYNWEDYKNNYHKNTKLPLPQYINDGLYDDLNSQFNMTILLTETQDDCDF